LHGRAVAAASQHGQIHSRPLPSFGAGPGLATAQVPSSSRPRTAARLHHRQAWRSPRSLAGCQVVTIPRFRQAPGSAPAQVWPVTRFGFCAGFGLYRPGVGRYCWRPGFGLYRPGVGRFLLASRFRNKAGFGPVQILRSCRLLASIDFLARHDPSESRFGGLSDCALHQVWEFC